MLGGEEASQAALRQQESVPACSMLISARRGRRLRGPEAGRLRRPGPALPELSLVLREGGRGRSRAPWGPRSGSGRALTPGHAVYRQPCYSLTDCFHGQRTNRRLFTSGAGISRCLRLREPVPFVWQEMSLVVCSQPLPEPRAGPGPGKDKAGQRPRLRQFSSSAPSLGRSRRKQQSGDREGRKPSGGAGKAAQPRRRSAHGAGAGGGRRTRAARPGARLFVVLQRAVMQTRLPGFLKKQRTLFLQGCSQATRPSNFGAA